MIISDKFTVNGRSRTRRPRCRFLASILEKKNKSIPRTRKEKCQTAGCSSHMRPTRRPHATAGGRFSWRLTAFRLAQRSSKPRSESKISDVSDTPLSEMSENSAESAPISNPNVLESPRAEIHHR